MITVLWIFLATLALGVRFNIPRSALVFSAAIASSCFGVVLLLQNLGAQEAESAFVGAFLVAMSSEILARFLRVPSPVLSIPGVIPLVPGSVAYRAVIHLVKGEQVQGLETSVKVVLTAVGIASGLLLASALGRRFLGPIFRSDKR